jgi:hypothetical protein
MHEEGRGRGAGGTYREPWNIARGGDLVKLRHPYAHSDDKAHTRHIGTRVRTAETHTADPHTADAHTHLHANGVDPAAAKRHSVCLGYHVLLDSQGCK